MRPVLLALALSLTAGSAMAAEFTNRTVRVSNVLTEDHSVGMGMKAMGECLAERSGGKMKLQAYWGGALGQDNQVQQAMRTGTLDAATAATSSAAGLAPSMGLFDLPFLVDNEKEAYALLDGKVGDAMSVEADKAGLVVLAWWENGFRQMTNSKGPITKWEDLQGKKMRALPSPAHIAIYQAMGATALPMPFGETIAALETGAIDGMDNTMLSIEKLKIFEVQKYVAHTSHMYGPLPLFYSKKLFDQLSPDEQAALKACAAKGRDVQRGINKQMDDATIESLRAKGIKVNELSTAERQRMRDKTQVVYTEFKGKIGEPIVDLAQQQLTAIRK